MGRYLSHFIPVQKKLVNFQVKIKNIQLQFYRNCGYIKIKIQLSAAHVMPTQSLEVTKGKPYISPENAGRIFLCPVASQILIIAHQQLVLLGGGLRKSEILLLQNFKISFLVCWGRCLISKQRPTLSSNQGFILLCH